MASITWKGQSPARAAAPMTMMIAVVLSSQCDIFYSGSVGSTLDDYLY